MEIRGVSNNEKEIINDNDNHKVLVLEKKTVPRDQRALQLRTLKNKRGTNTSNQKYNKRMKQDIDLDQEGYFEIPAEFVEEVEKYIDSTTFAGQKNKLLESAFTIYRSYGKQGVLSAIDEAAHRLQPVIQKIS